MGQGKLAGGDDVFGDVAQLDVKVLAGHLQ